MEHIKHYSMIIQWDPRDKIYVVTVPELPGCMTHGNTYEEAVKQGQDAIESWIWRLRRRTSQYPHHSWSPSLSAPARRLLTRIRG